MSVAENNKTTGDFAIHHCVVIAEPGPVGVQPGQVTVTTIHSDGQQEAVENTKMAVKLPWQLTIWAWVLLVIEVLAMAALYLNGGGRVAAWVPKDGIDESAPFDIEDYECENQAGGPTIAKVLALRAATAVCTQLLLFCFSDRGLLKPSEAMWVGFAAFMRWWGVPEFAWSTTYTERDVDGRWRTYTEFSAHLWLIGAFVWVLIPGFIFWAFTGRPAVAFIAANCDLLEDTNFGLWFLLGYYVSMGICVVLLSCFSNGKKGENDTHARALVVVDAITIGFSYVWGNYVQSGVVAGVFGLLPAFNLYLSYREYRLMFEADSDPPSVNSPTITEV